MSTIITAGNATNNGASLLSAADGILEIKTGTGAGTTALTLSTSQIATFAGNVVAPLGTLYPIISGTAVASTSGTSIDFTGIPSWVKRITVMLSGVSTTGTSFYQVQLGTGSTTYTTTGYLGACGYMAASSAASTAMTTGFMFINLGSAASLHSGVLVITSLTGNTWSYAGNCSRQADTLACASAGSIPLAAALTAIRITTVNGTDTFDAGSINILYE